MFSKMQKLPVNRFTVNIGMHTVYEIKQPLVHIKQFSFTSHAELISVIH